LILTSVLCARSIDKQMALAAEAAEEIACRTAAAGAKRKPGRVGVARKPAAALSSSAAGGPVMSLSALAHSPVTTLYVRLANLFRDRFGVVAGICEGDAAPSAEEAAAVSAAWSPLEERLRNLALQACSNNEALLKWPAMPDGSITLDRVAATRAVTAFDGGEFEFAHRSVQVGALIVRPLCQANYRYFKRIFFG
jgi:hypothetical protein